MPEMPMGRKGPSVLRDGPYDVHGVMWMFKDGGVERILIRRPLRGTYETCELIHVRADAPFCHWCLSNRVLVLSDATLECLACLSLCRIEA